MTAADWFAKALKLLDTGASQDAFDALTTAIQLDPVFAEAYAYRAWHGSLSARRLRDTAMQDYDTAVNHDREDRT